MDANRGRSPSASRQQNIRHSTSASPHPQQLPTNSNNYLANDTTAAQQNNFLNAHAASGAFADSFTQDYSQQAQYSLGPTFTDFDQQQQQQNGAIANHTFLQSTQDLTGTSNPADSDAFPSFDFNQTNFDQNTSLDPSLLSADLDPTNALELLSAQTNSNGTLDPMAATMSSHSPTPPHLFNDMNKRHSGSPSPHASPNFAQAQPNYQMNRPRNVSESLDPSSAMFPQGQSNEWMGMGAYRSHKRTPSDNVSDISSNHASPYLNTLDSFDAANAHSSPLLNPTSDPTFNDGLGLQQFSLNENQQPFSHSPGHSPGHSPHLMPQPQHALPQFTADNNFGLTSNMNGQFVPQNNGLEMFPGVGQEPFPSLNNGNNGQGASPGELGQADHMSPPEINIDFAPPSRVPTDNMRQENSQDALSPPLRSE